MHLDRPQILTLIALLCAFSGLMLLGATVVVQLPSVVLRASVVAGTVALTLQLLSGFLRARRARRAALACSFVSIVSMAASAPLLAVGMIEFDGPPVFGILTTVLFVVLAADFIRAALTDLRRTNAYIINERSRSRGQRP